MAKYHFISSEPKTLDEQIEIWKDIPDYEGVYQASTFGRIQSLTKIRFCGPGNCATLRPGRILKLDLSNKGYYRALLQNGVGTRKRVGVHRLVLETFVGPCPEGMECCHIDGNPSNNKLENLKWGTHLENMRDRDRHGTKAEGERIGTSKLKKEEVKTIKRLLKENEGIYGTYAKLARMFNVNITIICDIRDKRWWKHIPDE